MTDDYFMPYQEYVENSSDEDLESEINRDNEGFSFKTIKIRAMDKEDAVRVLRRYFKYSNIIHAHKVNPFFVIKNLDYPLDMMIEDHYTGVDRIITDYDFPVVNSTYDDYNIFLPNMRLRVVGRDSMTFVETAVVSNFEDLRNIMTFKAFRNRQQELDFLVLRTNRMDEALNEARGTGTDEDYDEFEEYVNGLSSEIGEHVASYYRDMNRIPNPLFIFFITMFLIIIFSLLNN